MPRLTPTRVLTIILLAFLLATLYRLATHHHPLHLPLPASINPVTHAGERLENAENPSRTLVLATRIDEDTEWVYSLPGDWQWIEYDEDEVGSVPMKKGGVAMVYLTYIIDHYDDLPDITVFTHGQRYQWQNDNPLYDILPILSSLSLPHILTTGFTPLRCTWLPGCPAELYPRTPITSRGDATRIAAERAFPSVYSQLFAQPQDGDAKAKLAPAVPGAVGSAAGSQFAVSRRRIRMRGRGEYERYRQWLISTELEEGVVGRVMEFMWHIIFNMPPVYCPPAGECYCQTFGACNLTCTNGDCQDAYILPSKLETPKGWPELDGGKGGHEGWPEPGWEKKRQRERMEKESEEAGKGKRLRGSEGARRRLRVLLEEEREREEGKKGGKGRGKGKNKGGR